MYYFEIYQGRDGRENVFIDTRILDHKYDPVYYDTLTSVFSDRTIRQIRHVTLSGIPSGDYYLDIILRGRRNKDVDHVRTPFRISWSPEALYRNDFKTALRQLEYIAESDELDKLKAAATPEERMNAWNNFWLRRDPTPNTARNEAKEDYYRRIEYTNRYFSLLGKEGWRTDRGRIYIQYGEPDQIEDFPFEAASQFAYQVWYYYQIGIQRKFTFVDRWDDGDYRLQYPYDGIIR
ncbi:MAG: GWxTD domain-containing protein [candidate division Zixibacteria bacterium]|nr:GWxTD domain-containing protein [candidate division Zixibacteria bacterium]